MFRSIKTILLFIIIFITASGMPLYADTSALSFSLPFTGSSKEITSFDTSITMLSSSHPRLQVSLTANEKLLPLQFNEGHPVEVFLYSEEKLIKNVAVEEVSIQHGKITTLEMDFPQSFLDLPNGDYAFQVTLNVENLQAPITSTMLAVTYDSAFTYVKAPSVIDGNQTSLTLYFPDNNMDNLIPITRLIPYTRTPLRATIDELIKGPNPALGLPDVSPIPPVQRLSLNRKIANVYLPKDIGVYDEYASSAIIAVNSFVNSLTAIDGVDGVQFYFNNRILADGFHGMVMNEPISAPKGLQLYAGYRTTTNRILLTPLNSSIEDHSIETIFNALKYSDNPLLYNYTLQPPVPEDVMLLDYSIDGNTLRLKFNDAFAMEDAPRNLMIDAIVYTFTSLEGIDAIEFQVENLSSTLSNSSEALILNKPFFPSSYINPEI
ncbi:GerMN domain-containing protein [Clostridium formicaceticum]|uniref:Sporulation and spore germination n=1 Tax=Clostridium formicaceticum TaxID=1497 RepID=A0AAC9RQJ5_9CLOT|nr:GerMN domain-containing protein [Clostridium formicaceticum]AOY74751.1 hypothetical protein BJL90_01540 [Clostridium formicaceticum]ARE89138.1 Sporulation and spore germination [Clostridium formicaceticum]